MANIDKNVRKNQLVAPPGAPSRLIKRANSGLAAARENRSPGPSKTPKVTNTPTDKNANSFTRDSRAIAATMPSWRSATSMCRVPNSIVNAAIINAT